MSYDQTEAVLKLYPTILVNQWVGTETLKLKTMKLNKFDIYILKFLVMTNNFFRGMNYTSPSFPMQIHFLGTAAWLPLTCTWYSGFAQGAYCKFLSLNLRVPINRRSPIIL